MHSDLFGVRWPRRHRHTSSWAAADKRLRSVARPGGQMGLESESSTDARWRCSDDGSPTSTATGRSADRPSRKTLYRGDPGMWSWVLHRISRCHDLLLPVRPCPRHRTGAGQPAGLQRGRRDLQDTDRRLDGGRSGSRGALSRAQRNPGDLDRFLVGGSAPPAADAVDRRRRLGGGSDGRADRAGCAHGGAFL